MAKKNKPQEDSEVKKVKILALRNCSYGKQKFYVFKRYEIEEEIAMNLAKDNNVKITQKL